MKPKKEKFVDDDDGAVTVDWVVLCAAIVGLAALATAHVSNSAVTVGDYIANTMSD